MTLGVISYGVLASGYGMAKEVRKRTFGVGLEGVNPNHQPIHNQQMNTTVKKMDVPSIASVYSQCMTVIVMCSIMDRTDEDVVEEYVTFRNKMLDKYEERDMDQGLINRIDKRFRRDLRSTLRQVSSDREAVIEYIKENSF